VLQGLLDLLDEYVARNGFGKLAAGGLTVLTIAGVFGSLLGAPWLRVTTSILLGCAVILLLALLITERRRLHHQTRRDAQMLARYTRALPNHEAVHVLDWRQEVTIKKNGDAVMERTIRLGEVDDDDPHYLNVNSVYYGSQNLSVRVKRRVRVTAHRLAPGDSSREIRTHFTYHWTTTKDAKPRHDVLVHLEGGVEEGEKVIVRWDWPGFSADLRSGLDGEDFDVFFRVVIAHYDYVIRLRDVSKARPPSVWKKGTVQILSQDFEQGDFVIKFTGQLPAAGTTQGIRIDMPKKE
jgi:hypothetical protein